ncbi:hypothetical protein LTR62_003449 [Meristemomyces frigidus]|uniref:SIS domain-containing protein n=1 Tax=Meristemomyces frigidus TaxID=1508187 RepID=A0AAN7YKL5_9PEZI|nr:hypothetical protein LTR62_003449 [Meristemomyces frigidus]
MDHARATKRRRIAGRAEVPIITPEVSTVSDASVNAEDARSADGRAEESSFDDQGNALTTPPDTDDDILPDSSNRPNAGHGDQEANFLNRATHILTTEAAALAAIATLYQTSSTAQKGLKATVDAVLEAQRTANKLVICGVGKSAYIAQKLTATCKSLSIRASFLHACEAVHGDLGDVRSGDVLLFVSYSGKTPELLNLLPHLPNGITRVVLSSHLHIEDCPLLSGAEHAILIPAPIPEREEITFGVAAPTTSTTVALAVADMLALTIADEMHGGHKDAVFKRNHPGGAIGISEREVVKRKRRGENVVSLELPSPSISASDDG